MNLESRKRFEGKTAIITGSGHGMGRTTAIAFAREGANVVVVDINLEAAEQVVMEIQSQGGKAIALGIDVTKSDEVFGMVDTAVKNFGSIDILVNNAGLLRSTPIEEVSEEEWDHVMAVNLKGAFLCAQAVLSAMKANHYGKIINISSSAGRSTSELGGVHYTVSKTGMLGLTRHMARETAICGINVNAICPGLIDTPMIRQKAQEERLAYFLKQIPMGYLGAPEDTANLVLFLASEDARYITGATIDLNGGSLMM